MSLYKQFQTDTKIEKTGVWLEYGTSEEGNPVRIRIARAGGSNKAFEKLMEKQTRAFRRQIQNETLDNEQAMRTLRYVYAHVVVLDWENVQGQEGEDLPFTPENCIKLFEDLPDLFRDVQEQSQRAALFRAHLLETDAKN